MYIYAVTSTCHVHIHVHVHVHVRIHAVQCTCTHMLYMYMLCRHTCMFTYILHVFALHVHVYNVPSISFSLAKSANGGYI